MLKAALKQNFGNAVFDRLPRAESLYPHIKTIDFSKAGEIIFNDGDLIEHLFFPVECVLSTFAVMEDGASVEISFTGNKSVAGGTALFGTGSARFWTSVMIPGKALKIERRILKDFVGENQAAKNFLMQIYLSTLSEITQRAICNGKHQLAQRFSSWLLKLFEQTSLESLPLTHDVIAQKLGARRAGITNVAGNLQSAKAINYSRGVIRLIDRRRIEREACECYQSIKHAAANQSEFASEF